MKHATVVLLFGLAICQTASGDPGIARSGNFIVMADDGLLADNVLSAAETLRYTLAKQWLGRELPEGEGRTSITVRIRPDRDDAVFWPKDHPDRHFHRMWVFAPIDRLTGTTFEHEMTHLVLELAYGDALPTWASEGAACRRDDEVRKEARRQRLATCVRTGVYPAVETILDADTFSAFDHTEYAVASSLTEYLLTRSDRKTFLAFAIAGKKDGWDRALADHYQIRSTIELQTLWQAWLSR